MLLEAARSANVIPVVVAWARKPDRLLVAKHGRQLHLPLGVRVVIVFRASLAALVAFPVFFHLIALHDRRRQYLKQVRDILPIQSLRTGCSYFLDNLHRISLGRLAQFHSRPLHRISLVVFGFTLIYMPLVEYCFLFVRVISILSLKFFLFLLQHVHVGFALAWILFSLIKITHLLLCVAVLSEMFSIRQDIDCILGAVWE